MPEYAFGQDEARGILAVNPYAEGSDEWHAWGFGYDYAVRTQGVYENVLSGEWAGMNTISDVIWTVARAMGFESDDIDEDDVEEILNAYENGYAAYVAGWRI